MYERMAVMRIICLSFASLALLFTVMLIGTYVDASHQGLSCPDWPLCPNGFNFPPKKYLFEEIHRIVAAVTASVIIATASYAAKKLGIVRKTAIAAGIIVVVQIVLGMFVVNTKLEALLVATHLSTGVFLFALVLITFVSSFRLTKVTNHTSNY
ncbi:MAG TPA: COX15/CtaA family protein [Methylomirabilota bacterium]|nr:COX15/CtaA family protein [Methylomirabilota bacterium]